MWEKDYIVFISVETLNMLITAHAYFLIKIWYYLVSQWTCEVLEASAHCSRLQRATVKMTQLVSASAPTAPASTQ